MSNIRSVLFVCTGNSCRSIMAEGLLKKYLKELGKDHIKVFSAGVRALADFPPTDETAEVMKDEGVDITGLKSKNITPQMIRESDLILVMEDFHKDEVMNLAPEAASKVYLLKEFGIDNISALRGSRRSIADPIGRPMEDYMACLGDIKKEIRRIAQLL